MFRYLSYLFIIIFFWKLIETLILRNGTTMDFCSVSLFVTLYEERVIHVFHVLILFSSLLLGNLSLTSKILVLLLCEQAGRYRRFSITRRRVFWKSIRRTMSLEKYRFLKFVILTFDRTTSLELLFSSDFWFSFHTSYRLIYQ